MPNEQQEPTCSRGDTAQAKNTQGVAIITVIMPMPTSGGAAPDSDQ